MITAQQIKVLRLQHNYTQGYIANKIKVSQKTYSNMENGKSKITVMHLKTLSKLYKMSLEECIALVNQGDTKTSDVIKDLDANIIGTELLEGSQLSYELIDQLKKRINDLKLLLDSKNNNISLLKIEIENLKK